MGRSSQEQARHNRTRIVESASRLFRTFGVERVSVADIMRAIGLTVGGFYKHFASKEDLVREAFALSFDQASSAWGSVSKRHGHDPDRAAAIVRHYFADRPRDHTCPMLAFAPHVTSEATAPASLDCYRQGTEALFRQFHDHLRGSRVHKVAPAGDPEAKVLFAAMVGAGFLARSMGDTPWVRSVQEAIVAMAEPR